MVLISYILALAAPLLAAAAPLMSRQFGSDSGSYLISPTQYEYVPPFGTFQIELADYPVRSSLPVTLGASHQSP